MDLNTLTSSSLTDIRPACSDILYEVAFPELAWLKTWEVSSAALVLSLVCCKTGTSAKESNQHSSLSGDMI